MTCNDIVNISIAQDLQLLSNKMSQLFLYYKNQKLFL
jgi:hypothetical protein